MSHPGLELTITPTGGKKLSDITQKPPQDQKMPFEVENWLVNINNARTKKESRKPAKILVKTMDLVIFHVFRLLYPAESKARQERRARELKKQGNESLIIANSASSEDLSEESDESSDDEDNLYQICDKWIVDSDQSSET